MIRPVEAGLWMLLCAALLGTAFSSRVLGEALRADDAGQAWARIDVNRAEAGDLMGLPGMTFRKAHALVSTRAKRGEFKALEELSAVPGFTRNYVNRIQDLIEVH